MTKYKAVTSKQSPANPLPGDRPTKADTDRMVRVDQAGEYGAVRIYAGQRAVMGNSHPKAAMLTHMYEQEKVHLARFNKFINDRNVRPTLMTPFWHVAGFALGAGTALMGEKAAMACTQAVEDVIDGHYQEQLDKLDGADPELEEEIKKFQAEELEHKRLAEENGAEEALGYPLLSGLIKTGCKAAIWMSKRV
ncbi:MAG: demethoxyubiquinone hydroxylase family protein [Kordiimonadaceae bacterium]|nr:demethoxyubiquinone hydroxylase family protein [Kordiimonadaceae bacterium]